ncbi:LysR family transcriptional regulator, partial [Pseudomonas syringae pv. tagetis]
VQIDVTVTDEEFDILAEWYDAGVRMAEVIDQEKNSVPVSGDQRQGAFASPSYIELFGKPEHPSELAAHRCIGWRPAPHSAPY